MVWQSGHSLYSDRYKIERVLGQGGFGVAYLATDRQNRQVVIKTLRDEILIDPKNKYFCDRFKDEALKLAVCRHPHIVAVQNTFSEPYSMQIEGNLYPLEAFCLVMEYVDGDSLEQIVNQRGAMPEGEVLKYLHQIGSALEFVHDLGVLHRDIKPSNILVRKNRAEAVLIDFGLARSFARDSEKDYTVALTHGFAPPEQYSRKIIATEAVDVYALAATAYYALTSRIPVAAMDRMLSVPQPTVREVKGHISQVLSEAIAQGMALRVEERSSNLSGWLRILPPPVDSTAQIEKTISEIKGTLPTISYKSNSKPLTQSPVEPTVDRPSELTGELQPVLSLPPPPAQSALRSKSIPPTNISSAQTPLPAPNPPQKIRDRPHSPTDSLLLGKIDPDLLDTGIPNVSPKTEEDIFSETEPIIAQEIAKTLSLDDLDFDRYSQDLVDKPAIVQNELAIAQLDADLTAFSLPSALNFEAIDPELLPENKLTVQNTPAWDEAVLLLHTLDAPAQQRLRKLMIAVCTGTFPSEVAMGQTTEIIPLMQEILRRFNQYEALQAKVDYFVLNLTKPLLYAVVADTLLRAFQPLLD